VSCNAYMVLTFSFLLYLQFCRLCLCSRVTICTAGIAVHMHFVHVFALAREDVLLLFFGKERWFSQSEIQVLFLHHDLMTCNFSCRRAAETLKPARNLAQNVSSFGLVIECVLMLHFH
jgi:hypothetical protein